MYNLKFIYFVNIFIYFYKVSFVISVLLIHVQGY